MYKNHLKTIKKGRIMKHLFVKISLLLFIAAVFVPTTLFAATKTFVKEYTYQAGDEDSKNSSRVIALREVKRLLLEELGTYLESRTEVKNFQLTLDQITTLTAGIVQTEIIAEKWDGSSYWLKSNITADPDKVVQSIKELRKDRDKTRELELMRQKSDELFRENERLRKELAAATDTGLEARKAAYDQSVKALSAADWLEKGHAAKDHKEAREAYSRAIELDPKNLRAWYARARISETGDAARKDYGRLLEIAPKTTEDYLIRAWTYKELDNRELAMQEFGKAIAAAPNAKEKANAYYDRGRYNYLFSKGLAVADFSKAIELDPANGDYYQSRGAAYWGLQQNDLALQDLNKAIELTPSSVNYGTRGAFYMLTRPELAIADLTRAIELEPNVFDYMNRAQTYQEMGKIELAIRDYSSILERFPEHNHFYISRANLYAELGRHDLALKDYNKRVQLNPDLLSSYMDRGKYFAKYGKHDLAIKDFTKAIQMKPEFDAYVERGLSYFKLGKDNLALQDYNTAIGLNYKHPGEAYYNRALLYARQKNAAKALQDVTRAMQIDPYYKRKAAGDPQFDFIKNQPEFIKTMGR